MARTIVSIISEQTIPNYLFIKEIFRDGDELLFISSKKMEKYIEWIIKDVKLECVSNTLVFEHENDEEKWDVMSSIIKRNLSSDKQYLVNLTGGTKYMSLAVQRIFEDFKSSFYYVPFPKNYILSLNTKDVLLIKHRVNVREYMNLYNLKITEKTITKDKSYSDDFFNLFTENHFSENEYSIIDKLRSYREKTISITDIEEKDEEKKRPQIKGLNNFLKYIKFQCRIEGKLLKEETQYITGGWFEEYIYHLIKDKLNPTDIRIGVCIQRTCTSNMNDLDVVFTIGNKLFVIECKTGVGQVGLFNQIVYKAAALKEYLLGLSGHSYIFSLSTEDADLQKTALNMGTTYCDRDYFLNSSKFEELFQQIKQKSCE